MKIKMFLSILLILLTTGCAEHSNDIAKSDGANIATSAATATPEHTEIETTPESSTSLQESIDYLTTSLENDPDIIDAGVALDGNSVSVVVMIINPEETDRVYLYTSSMCDVFLKEHGFKNVLIGIYKGDEQLKLDAHWIE